ncbi:MAG: putative rane protein [Pedosphaera sp.]|nr:putative rane protein [Pedosphaera sp.]
MFFYQLRAELWKLFAKKRTYIGFGMVMLAQLTVVLIFRYTKAQHELLAPIRRSGFSAESYLSMLTMATALMVILGQLILGLYVALVGGDFVSKESEDGTLRMILSRPISRMRLLCLKWLAGAVFSFVLVFALGLFGLLFAGIWFPVKGGLFVLSSQSGVNLYDFAGGLEHYMMALSYMVAKACAVMSLAFMFSCFNMKPAAATILALSLILIDHILMEIPYFHEFKYWFLAYHINAWESLLSDPVPWWRVWGSLSVTAGASMTFLIIGITAFQVRDIKS